MVRGSDFRRAALVLPAVLGGKVSSSLQGLVNTLAELSSLLYIMEEERTPRAILRLYNVSFQHAQYCVEVLHLPKKLSSGVLFGLYHHKLSTHAAEDTRIISNNFRWLNAVKEMKIVFFVRDNSGEKFLTAHAAGRNFSEVICRACAVVVHSWFSHLHGKFCVLALRTFPARPAPFAPRIWWVGTVGSQRPVLIFGFSWLHVQVFPISW